MYHLVNMDHPYYDNPPNPLNPLNPAQPQNNNAFQQHCELMTVNINTLIAEVEARSVLWDRSNLYYTDRYIKRAAWQEVYKALNPNFDQLPKLQQLLIGNAIERRWRSLREGFSKKVRNERRLSEGSRRSPYIYHQQLNFLRKVIVAKSTSSIGDEDCPVDSQSQRGSTLEEKLVQFLEAQEKVVRDEHQNFFDSLLPAVRKMDEQQSLSFRARVLNIIQEIQAASPEPFPEKVNDQSSDSAMDEYSGNYQHEQNAERENNYESSYANQSAYVSQGPSSTSDSGVDSPVCTSSLIQTAVCVALNMHQDSSM